MAEPTKPPIEVKRVKALERLKQLDEERAKLIEDATKEARKKADDAIEELNSLGFSYRLMEDGQKASKSGKLKVPRTKKDCTICKFGTEPHHDGRHPVHRDQGNNKKAFTEKQLSELGLTKKAAQGKA